jgi:CheY-like chemotaxis protein
VNIDDDEMARDGVHSAVVKADPTISVQDLNFDAAIARSDWSGVDYVVVDLSQPHNDPDGDDYPAVAVVRRIRALAPGRDRLHIIVITGAYGAHNDPFVIRRAVEAGADYLLYRTDFWRSLSGILAPGGPTGVETLDGAASAEPGLGVTAQSSLNDTIDAIRESGILTRKYRGGAGDKIRTRIQSLGRLISVSRHGGAKPHQQTVSRPQILDLYQRATRLPGRSDRD